MHEASHSGKCARVGSSRNPPNPSRLARPFRDPVDARRRRFMCHLIEINAKDDGMAILASVQSGAAFPLKVAP